MSDATYAHQDRGSAGAYASYYAGMDASMQQKVALTTAHFPTSGTVVDMGSGSGRGTFDLASLHPELALVGVDINPTAVATAAAMYQRPNLRYIAGDIADALFPDDSVDGILDSSVLHHVTSFNGYGTARLETCLDHQVRALRTDGVLIIRDFVVPDGPDEVALSLRDDDGAADGPIAGLSTWALWRRYAATVAHGRYRAGELPWSDLGADGAGWRRIRLGLRDAQEFLLRKDYRSDWDVELLEEYTYWTHAGFVAALSRRGLRVVTAAPIRNPWIVANRYRGRARLTTVAGAELMFPPTNFLIVGQKVARTQGTHLRLQQATTVERPDFLRLSTWRGDDGTVVDLAERPGRTLDLIPWVRRDGQVLVLAKQGFPRPVVVADPERPNLTGASWSGYLTEPIAAITAPAEPVDVAVRRILRERAGVAADVIAGIGRPVRYATSPGGLDEVVTALAVGLAALPPEQKQHYGALYDAGVVRALDARACLRAAQIGGLFDARLELGIHRLLRTLGLPGSPWIGAAFTLPDHDLDWPVRADALHPADGVRFVPVARRNGYLAIRRGRFLETAADGRVVDTTEREWLATPTVSGNTAVALPVVRIRGCVLVGVEHRAMPAVQLATGDSAYATAPAWRLPATVTRLDHAERWVEERLREGSGCAATNLIELGGPWLATPGATPELVHPWLVAIDPRQGPGDLHWLPLAAAVADAPVDAHLAIAAHRAAQVLADTQRDPGLAPAHQLV